MSKQTCRIPAHQKHTMSPNTDGSLALLYHCLEAHSPLHTMNQRCERMPIFFLEQRSSCFRGPLYLPNLSLHERANFTDLHQEPPRKNLEDKNSWFTLTPSHENWDLCTHAFFGPNDIQPMITRSFPGSQYAGIYSPYNFLNFSSTSSLAKHQGTQEFSLHSSHPKKMKMEGENGRTKKVELRNLEQKEESICPSVQRFVTPIKTMSHFFQTK